MLKLIVGGAGSGKTVCARELVCRYTEEGKKPLLIVPEQFSFETERAMLGLLGAQRARDAEVLSFSRLAEQLARQYGGCAGVSIDDCGRAAAMAVTLSRLRGGLRLYRDERSASYIDHLLDAVKEFKVCGITAPELERAASLLEGTQSDEKAASLGDKLHDLALIYADYQQVVAKAYTDKMDDLDRLAEQLSEYRCLNGRVVVMDSFRGFTGQELKVVKRIIEQAAECVITLCYDDADGAGDEYGLFSATRTTMLQLLAAAKEAGVGAETERLTDRPRFRTEPLRAIERGVMRAGKRVPFERFEDGVRLEEDCVTVYRAEDRYDEAEFCAREARRLLREEGYSCSDITLIARSADSYSHLVADAMRLQGIPCFADERIDAAESALMQFVLAALELSGAWQTETILRCLKTGMIDGISDYDVDLVENYCFIWDVRGRDWREPFASNPDGFARERDDGEAMSEEQRRRLDKVNAVRVRTMELLGGFCDRMHSTDGPAMAKAVYLLLDKAGAGKRLGMLCKSLDLARSEEQTRVWEALMDILDQVAVLTEGVELSRENFCSMLSMMISRCEIGHIPQTLDETSFGAADRIRTTAPRAVFVLGAVDGELPAAPGGSGVFTDIERVSLREELGLPVAEPVARQLLEERLLVYTTLCSASERLYLTYPETGENGVNDNGECIREVLSCVPGARMLYHDSGLAIDMVESADAAFELAARHLSDNTGLSRALVECVRERPGGERMTAVERAANEALPTLSSREAARTAFGNALRMSASQLEKYSKCPYMYLCQYGFGVRAPRRARIDNLEIGTITHYVLENFFAELVDGCTENQCRAAFARTADIQNFGRVQEETAKLLERCLSELLGGAEGKHASMLAKLRRMRDGLAVLIVNIAQEFTESDFRMDGFEVGIGEEAEIKPTEIATESGRVSLVGSVDRVDSTTLNGKKYVRVIDYKTGGKTLNLNDVRSGLNMQMLVYLDQLCSDQSGRYADASAAGVLYMPSYSNTIEMKTPPESDSAVDKERLAKLRRNGFFVDDREDPVVCRATENSLEGKFITPKAAVSGALDGKTTRSIYSPEQYGIIRKYVRWKIGRIAEDIFSGRFEPSPVVSSGFGACEWCDYYPICRYDGAMRQMEKSNDCLGAMEAQMNGEAQSAKNDDRGDE